MKQLWEILVPTTRNDGRPIKTRFHRVWDTKVREIAGGLTILTPVKGQWVCEDGNLFSERMIPVRIVCDSHEIERIMDMTADYYDQKAIMVFLVSKTVVIKNYDREPTT